MEEFSYGPKRRNQNTLITNYLLIYVYGVLDIRRTYMQREPIDETYM